MKRYGKSAGSPAVSGVNGVFDNMIPVRNSYASQHLPRAMLLTYPMPAMVAVPVSRVVRLRQAHLFLDSRGALVGRR